jgi:hypothetical protein
MGDHRWPKAAWTHKLTYETEGDAGERNSMALQTLHFLVQDEKKSTSLLLRGTFNIG